MSTEMFETIYNDGTQGRTIEIDVDGRCWLLADERGNVIVRTEIYGTGEPLMYHRGPLLDYRERGE